VQVDDLLTFRQFSKKSADDVIDVSIVDGEQLQLGYAMLTRMLNSMTKM
jgi:hypothetical protein